MVLVDTDVMIDLLRQYSPAVSWLASLREEEIFLPGLVAMELVQGCRNQQEQDRLLSTLDQFQLIWPSALMCDEALTLFARFHLSHGLGILDALIGQTAVALGLPLHTFNIRHYAMIPHIQLLQPYKRI